MIEKYRECFEKGSLTESGLNSYVQLLEAEITRLSKGVDENCLTEKDKYRAFRNYMVNELKIDRDQLEEWSREAVRKDVEKRMGSLDFHAVVKSLIPYNHRLTRSDIFSALKEILSEKIVSGKFF